MISFVGSALITFGLLQLDKCFTLMSGFEKVFAIVLVGGLLFLGCHVNFKQSDWVFLRKKDGTPLSGFQLAAVCMAASGVLFLLLKLAAFNWLITFAFFFVILCGFDTVCNSVRESYKKARDKRKEGFTKNRADPERV